MFCNTTSSKNQAQVRLYILSSSTVTYSSSSTSSSNNSTTSSSVRTPYVSNFLSFSTLAHSRVPCTFRCTSSSVDYSNIYPNASLYYSAITFLDFRANHCDTVSTEYPRKSRAGTHLQQPRMRPPNPPPSHFAWRKAESTVEGDGNTAGFQKRYCSVGGRVEVTLSDMV